MEEYRDCDKLVEVKMELVTHLNKIAATGSNLRVLLEYDPEYEDSDHLPMALEAIEIAGRTLGIALRLIRQ